MGAELIGGARPDSAFSSLFIGMDLAIVMTLLKVNCPPPFSSLFIGMDLAMGINYARRQHLQYLSVPFSSGWTLRYGQQEVIALVEGDAFSSLFIGMDLAILLHAKVAGPSIMTFSSLFIGMDLAIFPLPASAF